MSTSLGERLSTIVDKAKEIVAAAETSDLDTALNAAGAISLEVGIINDVLDSDHWADIDSSSRFNGWAAVDEEG